MTIGSSLSRWIVRHRDAARSEGADLVSDLRDSGAQPRRGLGCRSQWEPDGERCALALARAVGRNRAAVTLNNFPRDRHAKAQTAIGRSTSDVGLAETLEHIGEELAFDPDAVILHENLSKPVTSAKLHVHESFFWRELHRVGYQVDDHLLQPFGVGQDQRHAGIQAAGNLNLLIV